MICAPLLFFVPLAASPQVPFTDTTEVIATLNSLGPQTQGTPGPSQPYLDNFRMTIGDVNGDDVADFVFSNQLGYLEIVCFPTNAYTGTPTRVSVRVPNLSTTTDCSALTGGGVANLRRRSLSREHDDLLIYDIDLDGVNEIICTDLAVDSNWEMAVGLSVIDVSGTPSTSMSAAQKTLTSDYYAYHSYSVPGGVQPNVASISNVMSPNNNYFKCGDKDTYSVKMSIVNVRGTTVPQDILVYAVGGDRDFAHAVYSYSNGSGSTSNTLNVAMYVNPGYDTELPNVGEPGHTRLCADVNGDGKDEVIGRHVFEYDPTITSAMAAGNPDVKNGKFLWVVQHLQGIDKHIDSLVGGDIVKNVRVSDGLGGTRVVAAPGTELAMCPQHPVRVTGGSSQAIDGGGVWLYRGMSGHTSRWPRNLINHDPLADFFTAYNALAYVAPSPFSSWGTVGSAFGIRMGEPFVGDMDPQEVVLADFHDDQPGRELLTLYKSIPRTTPSGWTSPNLLWRLCGTLFGSDSDLTGHNVWFNFAKHIAASGSTPASVDTLRNGPGALARPIDFRGSRDKIECYSVMNGLIRGIFPGGVSIPPSAGVDDPFHKMIFELEDGFAAHTVRFSLYGSTASNNSYETWFANSQPADMFGDSREEYAIFHHLSNSNQFVRITTSTDTTTGGTRVGQPSPYAFIDYRRKRDTNELDYRRFDGQHLYGTTMPKGTLGQPYGRVLDRAFWPNTTTSVTGAVLLPEGGTPPYTVTIIGGSLHTGLAAVSRNARDYATGGTPIVADYQGAISIEGTPSESGHRRLTVQVVDAASVTTTHTVWISVDDPTSTPANDPRPQVVASSFDGAFLVGGTPQDLIVRALVSDPQNDCLGVALLDSAGNSLGVTALDNGNAANGDLFASDGVYSAKFTGVNLPAGTTFDMQMVAVDAGLLTSTNWPFLTIEGGEGMSTPAFDSAALPGGQTQATTPTIDFVLMPQHTIPPAETTDATGSQSIFVAMKFVPTGSTTTAVKARIRHNVPGVDPIEVVLAPLDAPTNMLWGGTFTSPTGEIGYGRYSVNVQATATVTSTSAQLVSDWWPQLRWH